MKTMFLLISHHLTNAQMQDALKTWKVKRVKTVPSCWWGQIPPEADSVLPYLHDVFSFLSTHGNPGDLLLVQGDFGATMTTILWARDRGFIPLYATTKRIAYEHEKGERIITTREFRHVRFRPYELGPYSDYDKGESLGDKK